MIDLRNGELKDILPLEFTRHPQVAAISYAIKQAYQTYAKVMDKILVYAFIDGAPEFALDMLAVELNVRYYNNDYPIDIKRDLIKKALIVTAKDGTNYAVETVILSIWGNGTVDEWYEYDGTPNHFRISLEAVISDADLTMLISLIENVKRKTARLDGVEMHVRTENNTMYYGSLIMLNMPVRITTEGHEDPVLDPDAVGYFVDELLQQLLDEDGNMLIDANVPYYVEGGLILVDEFDNLLIDELSAVFTD